MPSERTAIGLLLQERREALRWSRTDVQRRTHVPSPTLEKWEMGRVKQPPAEPLLRVARELRIEMDDLWRALAADAKRPGRRRAGTLLIQELDVTVPRDARGAAAGVGPVDPDAEPDDPESAVADVAEQAARLRRESPGRSSRRSPDP